MSEATRARRYFPWRIFARIIVIHAILVFGILTLSGLSIRYFFKHQFIQQSQLQLSDSLRGLANAVPAKVGSDWCTRYAHGSNLRLTVINRSGAVICDSLEKPGSMESHADRPEFIAALRNGEGRSVRHSETLGKDLVYSAISIRDGSLVLRGARPQSVLQAVFRSLDYSLVVFLVFVALLLMGFAVWAGQTMFFPIGRLLIMSRAMAASRSTGHAPLPPRPVGEAEELGAGFYGELSDLEASLDTIRRDLETKSETLTLAREEQATLMAAISDAIFAVDADGAPLFYNTRFEILFGKERLVGKNLHLWEMFREPGVLETYRMALNEAKTASVSAVPFDQDGIRKHFAISVAPLRKRDGQIYGAVGIFHDVTELKQAEQIRIDFVANVSHELRTPVTAIKGFTDTILQDLDSGRPVAREFVDVIARNTVRLRHLVDDLLDLSSMDSNADVLQKSALRTEEVTARVLSQMEQNFAAKDQTVETEIHAAEVNADPRRLEQVLTNLLDNAGKYTPVGGKIMVRWQRDDRGGVLLKISDTGPGINPEHHARLFERFYRVDKARSRDMGGTGLGLAIVKHIMQRHGGTVWVESRAGQGSTFICRFL